MNPTQRQFFGGLGSLRGFAVLMVVLYHVDWPNPVTGHRLFQNGYLMVDLCFVLSGFVICHNYVPKIRTGNDVLPFMILRFGRLYPLHLFFLLLFLGLEIVKYFAERKYGFVAQQSRAFTRNNASAFIANLLLVQPFSRAANKTFNAPSWNVGVQFYCYLVFAVVVLIFRRRRGLSLAAALLAALSALLLIGFGHEGLTATAGLNFLRCLTGFFTGVVAHKIYAACQASVARWSTKLAWCLVAFLVAFLSLKQDSRLDYVVIPAFAVLIIALAAMPAGSGGTISRILNSVPIRWLGKISYSIYMCQLLVLIFMTRAFALAQRKLVPGTHRALWDFALGLGSVLLAVASVLVVAFFTQRWIEATCQNGFRSWVARRFTTNVAGPARVTT